MTNIEYVLVPVPKEEYWLGIEPLKDEAVEDIDDTEWLIDAGQALVDAMRSHKLDGEPQYNRLPVSQFCECLPTTVRLDGKYCKSCHNKVAAYLLMMIGNESNLEGMVIAEKTVDGPPLYARKL